MPKRLLLIRHAKSSWDDPLLADHQRPLAQRGIKACETMARYCEDLLELVDAFYCSTAKRAKQTLELLNCERRCVSIYYDEALYTFDVNGLEDKIANIDSGYNVLAVIGHNPAITDFVNKHTKDYIENVPTAAFVLIEFQFEDWDSLLTSVHQGTVLSFGKPKQFK